MRASDLLCPKCRVALQDQAGPVPWCDRCAYVPPEFEEVALARTEPAATPNSRLAWLQRKRLDPAYREAEQEQAREYRRRKGLRLQGEHCWWCGAFTPEGVCMGPHPDYDHRLARRRGNWSGGKS